MQTWLPFSGVPHRIPSTSMFCVPESSVHVFAPALAFEPMHSAFRLFVGLKSSTWVAAWPAPVRLSLLRVYTVPLMKYVPRGRSTVRPGCAENNVLGGVALLQFMAAHHAAVLSVPYQRGPFVT